MSFSKILIHSARNALRWLLPVRRDATLRAPASAPTRPYEPWGDGIRGPEYRAAQREARERYLSGDRALAVLHDATYWGGAYCAIQNLNDDFYWGDDVNSSDDHNE